MVTGASPGLGKTTLARGLCHALQARGTSAELLEERDAAERPEFADVIAAIRTRGSATVQRLVDAADRYLGTCRRTGSAVNVADAVLPFFPSTLSRGHGDSALLAMCEALGPLFATLETVQLHLHGNARVALERAIAREGPGWLQAAVAAERRRTGAPTDPVTLDDVVAYSTDRRALTAPAQVPWRVAA